MGGKFQFRDQWYALAPPWLRTDNAERYEYVQQVFSDLLMEKTNQAIRIRLPGLGDPSQLPYLANDRQLAQGPAESNASFVTRLQQAFQTWGLAGAALAVLGAVQAYMQNLQPGVAATMPLATIVGGPTYGPVVVTGTTDITQSALYGVAGTLNGTTLILNVNGGGALTLALSGSGNAASLVALLTAINAEWSGLNAQQGGPSNDKLVLTSALGAAGSLVVGIGSANTALGLTPERISTYAVWNQHYQGDAIGAPPTQTIVTPSNFNWDNQAWPWRSWLILPMSLVATGLSGAAAATSTATGGSYTNPGQNVSGVWVPATSGTPVNAPFLTITGLSGIPSSAVGQWLTLAGSAHAGNNGTFPITHWVSASSVVIANPSGVAADAGPLTWSIGEYPWIAPGPVWGTPGIVFGEGESSVPPVILGANLNGTWQPSQVVPGTGTTIAWGLDCLPDTLVSIRALVKQWKSAATYYPNIVVTFDSGTGIAGSSYSPNSATGSGNPDGSFGSFGSFGKNVGGVWIPARLISSPFDAYCQGTGVAQQCSVENLT
jgi:hypothetical protein